MDNPAAAAATAAVPAAAIAAAAAAATAAVAATETISIKFGDCLVWFSLVWFLSINQLL